MELVLPVIRTGWIAKIVPVVSLQGLGLFHGLPSRQRSSHAPFAFLRRRAMTDTLIELGHTILTVMTGFSVVGLIGYWVADAIGLLDD